MNTDKEKHVIPSEINRAIKERIEYLEQEDPALLRLAKPSISHVQVCTGTGMVA